MSNWKSQINRNYILEPSSWKGFLPQFEHSFHRMHTHIRSMLFLQIYWTDQRCIHLFSYLFDFSEHIESNYRFHHLNMELHLITTADRMESLDYYQQIHIQELYTFLKEYLLDHNLFTKKVIEFSKMLINSPIIQRICWYHKINGISCRNNIRNAKQQICDHLIQSKFTNFS